MCIASGASEIIKESLTYLLEIFDPSREIVSHGKSLKKPCEPCETLYPRIVSVPRGYPHLFPVISNNIDLSINRGRRVLVLQKY